MVMTPAFSITFYIADGWLSSAAKYCPVAVILKCKENNVCIITIDQPQTVQETEFEAF